MNIKILKECGYEEALLGLSLSYNTDRDMSVVAEKLADKDGGHNKFLESIVVWLDIDAPRFWWSQCDTYRSGITKQSESTMHTIMKRELTVDDFEDSWLPEESLTIINERIRDKKFDEVKILLPEGFLQRRIVCTNYKTLRAMINQRKTHKLKQWSYFCDAIKNQVAHSELLQ